MSSLKSLGSRALRGYMLSQLEAVPSGWVGDLSREFKSDQETETYAGVASSAPVLREWKGSRKFETLRAESFMIRNIPFESGIEVTVDEIRRNKVGQVQERIDDLVQRANDHWAQLLSALILQGASQVCYDKKYFFATDHQEGESPSQSNLLTSTVTTPSAPTVAEMENTVITTTQQLFLLKDDRGEPLNAPAKRFTVMAPIHFMKPLAGALNTQVILEGGQSRNNVLQAFGGANGFSYDLVFNPRLTGNKMWLFRADAARKPLIRQVEVDTQVNSIAEGSDEEKLNRRHLYMVDRICNVGFGDWKGSIQVNFST